MEEGGEALKETNYYRKECFQMEMIHFAIKDWNFHKSKDVEGTITLNLPSNNE